MDNSTKHDLRRPKIKNFKQYLILYSAHSYLFKAYFIIYTFLLTSDNDVPIFFLLLWN